MNITRRKALGLIPAGVAFAAMPAFANLIETPPEPILNHIRELGHGINADGYMHVEEAKCLVRRWLPEFEPSFMWHDYDTALGMGLQRGDARNAWVKGYRNLNAKHAGMVPYSFLRDVQKPVEAWVAKVTA